MRWRFRAQLHPDDFPRAAREAASELAAFGLLEPSALWDHLRDRLPPEDAWTFQPLLDYLNARRVQRRPPPPLTRAALAEAVTFLAEREGRRVDTPTASRISNLLVVLFVPGLLLIAWQHHWIADPVRDQMAVTARRGLPAYHVVTTADVALKRVAIDPQAIVDPGKAVGRLTMRALRPDQVVYAAHLTPAGAPPDLDLPARSVFSLPVRNTDATLAASLPVKVTLFFSKKPDPGAAAATAPADKDGQGRERHEAYLLALAREATGSIATVAVPADTLDAIQPLLSTRDVTIVWRGPR
jgi:hypothetical protein